MDFTLTPDQELVRDAARTILAKECPPSLVREVAVDPAAADPLWEHLRDWVGLAAGPLPDLCLFMEQAGAALLPGPFFATTALYLPLVRAAGRERGGETGTVALAGEAGDWVVNDDPVRTFVPEADRVDEVAIVLPGPAVLVAAPPPATRPVDTLDLGRRFCDLDVPDDVSGAAPLDAATVLDVVERATVALAADMVGTARRILEMSVAYAGERVQFDRPIGSFQAIQHKLADMALDVERATAAVYYAAMAVDADAADRHRAVHAAKAAAGDACRRAARDGVQVHGGIGYTWEHDLHLYLRRAYTSEHLLGTTAWHHDRLADLLFD